MHRTQTVFFVLGVLLIWKVSDASGDTGKLNQQVPSTTCGLSPGTREQTQLLAAICEATRISELCKKQQSLLQAAVEQNVGIDAFSRTAAKQAPSVIFIGESHAESDKISENYYPILLEKMRNTMPKLNCVAVEAPAFRETQEFKEYAEHPYAKNDSTFVPHWGPLLRRSVQLGMKIYAIDSDAPLETENSSVDQFVARNVFMASKIKNLLLSGACSQILVINGNLHLWDKVRDSIPTLLARDGYQSFKIRMLDLSPGTGPMDRGWLNGGLVWKDSAHKILCSDLPGSYNGNIFAFSKSLKDAADVPVNPLYANQVGANAAGNGTISDFDAVVGVGCPNSAEGNCARASRDVDVGYLLRNLQTKQSR